MATIPPSQRKQKPGDRGQKPLSSLRQVLPLLHSSCPFCLLLLEELPPQYHFHNHPFPPSPAMERMSLPPSLLLLYHSPPSLSHLLETRQTRYLRSLTSPSVLSLLQSGFHHCIPSKPLLLLSSEASVLLDPVILPSCHPT